MSGVRKQFPGIAKAVLEMSRDCGGINKYRPETTVIRQLEQFMANPGIDIDLVRAADAWLLILSPSDFETVCCGEQDGAEEILRAGPPFTGELLDRLFDEVA